jgi:hypothetical protein
MLNSLRLLSTKAFTTIKRAGHKGMDDVKLIIMHLTQFSFPLIIRQLLALHLTDEKVLSCEKSEIMFE